MIILDKEVTLRLGGAMYKFQREDVEKKVWAAVDKLPVTATNEEIERTIRCVKSWDESQRKRAKKEARGLLQARPKTK